MNNEWQHNIQLIIDKIDACIRSKNSEALTLSALAQEFGYSEYHFSRKFRELSGIQLRDYLRYRKLALAAKRVRDSGDSLLDIALDNGFSSHEAFTRAFKEAYGITPSEYRQNPVPLALHTVIKPFDCYLAETVTASREMPEDVKAYFVRIPAHKFLHIRNYESIGYWDFWQKQSSIPGQDHDTVCALLDGIEGKLDEIGSGHVMAYINDPSGRICSWGIPLAECYGLRLPRDYNGEVPPQMLLSDIPEGDYIVFEHGPFDLETENSAVEAKIEKAMKNFDYSASGYVLDTRPGRAFYFYHDYKRYWKYIRPVRKR